MNQERFVATPFWELFEMPFAEGARPWEACQDVSSRGGEFVVHGVRVAGKYERGSFTMRFRCESVTDQSFNPFRVSQSLLKTNRPALWSM